MNTRPPYGMLPETGGDGRIPAVYGDSLGNNQGFGNQPPAHSVSSETDAPPYEFAFYAWRGNVYEQVGEE